MGDGGMMAGLATDLGLEWIAYIVAAVAVVMAQALLYRAVLRPPRAAGLTRLPGHPLAEAAMLTLPAALLLLLLLLTLSTLTANPGD